MSEVPQDIVDAVDALMDAAIAANDDVSTEQMMTRAIMAERDRCVRIAASMPGWKQPRDVAKAITDAGRAALAEKEGMR